RAYIEARDVVQRKHVIDGCQATDLPPGYKYERQNGDEGDGVYMRDGVSGTKMASIMIETVGAIKNALKEAIDLTEAQGIDDGEREHIELCVSLIQTECEYLLAQADSVPEMSELL
ncbi:MAG: HipA domain-containing protein, partial [Vibrio ordalii]